MLTNRNQLPEPQALVVPEFEPYLASFKAEYVASIRQQDSALADQVEQTLSNEGELLTKMAETFSVMLRNEIQRRNQQVTAMLPGYAKGADLEAVVANLGIERQEVVRGDSSAFPVVEAVEESDEDVLRRYWLAPHRPAAGSRLQYKALGLMLDEVPVIVLDKPADNQVRLTYTFAAGGFTEQIKDVEARQTAPGSVKVAVLGRAVEAASAELLDKVAAVYARDHVLPETDEVTVEGAGFVEWQADVIAWVHDGPDVEVLKTAMQGVLSDYAEEARVLGGSVQLSRIDQIFHNAGAAKIDINSPGADVVAQWDQAPLNNSMTVDVRVIQ